MKLKWLLVVIEEANQLQALSSAGKISIYIIIAQSNYEVKLGRLVTPVALVAQREEQVSAGRWSYSVVLRCRSLPPAHR